MERYLVSRNEESAVGESWIRQMRYLLLRFPHLLDQLGATSLPETAASVTAEQIKRLRGGMRWERATFAQTFAALKGFLRWARNPLGDAAGPWRLPSGQPTHRRWLRRAQLRNLYRATRAGPEKLIVALEGFNGLRRVEVLRLRVQDVSFLEGTLRVLGKGRHGGKWRTIPMHPSVKRELRAAVRNKDPGERLLPFGASWADSLLRRAAKRALLFPGIMISHHDLRRTFGRLARESGIDLVQLQHLYGHRSIDMTAHYIGLDTDQMRVGLEKFARYVR